VPNEPVGISILTNGQRRQFLEACVSSFLANCHYRPLVIAIHDNGSTDDTSSYEPPKAYAVRYIVKRSDVDFGCAKGTNISCEMVRDCRYAIHIESDFCHLSPEVTGVDKMWLHRAVNLMDSGDCDYLYLRRMMTPSDMLAHWWSQWMPRVNEKRGEWLRCPGFWWSNNPSLFRNETVYGSGTLPLDEKKDGKKGEPGWSRPELETPRPTKTWIHRWGMFAHEMSPDWTPHTVPAGCGKHESVGMSTCKYGFYINDRRWDVWCKHCDHSKGFEDMVEQEKRFRRA